MSHTGWIAVDLDSTLAVYEGWHGIDHIGDPVPAMVARVKAWLDEGKDVRIFTARVSRHGFESTMARNVIEQWCKEHIGRILPVTHEKDFGMIELWDDRCRQVEPNTGVLVSTRSAPCPYCGEEALGTGSNNGVAQNIVCFACNTLIWHRTPTA